MDGKIRTGTDARGSKQKRCFKARQIAKILKLAGLVLPRTAKTQNGHGWRWFQADGLVFAMDSKTQNGHGRPWFQAEAMF
ncbi:hypothetical protein [Treponema phagedenis]|uniref:hypothetical protein n=1 Tax=Treponema phagedenis TaxID=162 RepID=UPI00125B90C0|nr:hypothetical protein [Treponema phagedenis]TYT79705.1 hypothetical protein FS559_11840 [Treponema phagedenis]